jgi:L-threonylcarbamoyladenylate synthase
MLELLMLTLSYEIDSSDIITAESLDTLRKGGIMAYSTESYYALGVLATDEAAVKRLIEIKNRPPDKPLPVIVGDMDTLKSIVKKIPDRANELIHEHWPGPLTIIFEAQTNVPDILTAGTGKVAVRIPGECAALYLAKSLKLPVTATSANPSSKQPADSPDMVKNYFRDDLDLLIDAGMLPGGKPSTIVDVTVSPPKLLRKGRVEVKVLAG